MRHALGVPCLVVLAGCAGPPPASHVTPAALAAGSGNVAELRALAASGRDLNAFDPGLNHWTPLLHAVHKGQRAAIDALLEGGADVNRRTRTGLSPLELAVVQVQPDIVGRLLSAGADAREPGVFLAAIESCNRDIVRRIRDRVPELRIPHNARGSLTLLSTALRCPTQLHLL